ncbi:amidase [Hoeflea prorocentri]|uniref:Indoleacetamide hydrolase n=1 Tax=Hoeflea prorocentri TaxID=1922333 RepID=A0A9X3ZIL1_9HYPH|nr:amidase [Hoeflea prorocentri]MCY6381840.1 amidase [Hoeflea prorocentri]MDA5399640.1 amidase [Hoeflea prorocentri]
MEETIARIEHIEPQVNAFTSLRLEYALDRANEIQNQAANGRPLPPLCGLPLAVKDNSDLAGLPTSGASTLAQRGIAEASDPSIAALEDKGAIGIGKTNLSELGGANTTNALFGSTLNPYDLRLTAGGSSGGTAAALSTGCAYLGHGNDVGGSLRTPAAFCGLFGLRPTPGLVPRRTGGDAFDTVFVEGPMARTLADLGLTLDAMLTEDNADPFCRGPAGTYEGFYAAATSPRPMGRFAFSEDMNILPLENGVRSAFKDGIEKLANQGVPLEQDTPDVASLVAHVQVLRSMSYAAHWGHHLPENADAFTKDVYRDISLGLSQSARTIAHAQRIRTDTFHELRDFFKTYDLLICPTVQVAPFPFERAWPKTICGVQCESYIDWIMITYIWSLVGCPSVAMPVGLNSDGLPLSLQLVGPPKSEKKLLNAAAFISDILT